MKDIQRRYLILLNIYFCFSLIFFVQNALIAQTTQNSLKKNDSVVSQKNKTSTDSDSQINPIQIDTGNIINQIDTTISDTITNVDSLLLVPLEKKSLTNTQIFVYILLSVIGLALFFFIFVQTLFRTFHKTRSTRQSLLLSWNSFFVVSIIWVFIIWGIVAEFCNESAFMIVMIFLFIISLIMTIIAIKSK